ncbi:MAG: glycosyltransferase family 39 protein, partial [bacterium]|nr:glycosyltransferase family 39 protein [bacterium]
MPQVVSILFGAAFTVAVCLAIGRMLFRRLGIRLHRLEEGPLAFVTGAACLSFVVFVVCALRLAYEATFLAIGAAALILAWRTGAHKPPQESFEPLSRGWRALLTASFALFGVLYLANAMAPEMSPDGSTYHLGLVDRYLRDHGFVRITTHMYANLSQGIDLLYLFAYAFGRHSSAALVHFAFLIAVTTAMLSYARRFGFAAAGVVGALLFFLSPVVGKDGTTAYNDVAVAAIVFTVFYLLQLWATDRRPSLVIPIGLAAGFCFAAKYTAFLAVPYAVIFIGWKLWRDKQPFLKPLVIFSVCALLMIAPWVAKNWVWLGNPGSPFFNSVFPNPHIHVAFEKGYAEHLRHYDLEGLKSH